MFSLLARGAVWSQNLVWDVGTLSWVVMTQPAGGGGGAVTVADGADATQGTIADVAVQGDNPGTISAKLRGLNKSIAAGIPITAAAPLAVTGPLTDTQLRAVAVPVSAAALPLPTGAATSALQTQPDVDIGDVTINNGAAGAAVNIQDGGNSITVDGTVAAVVSPTTGASAPATASVGVASAQVVAANASRKGLVIVNLSTANISFGIGATAVLSSGITLTPNGVWVMDPYTFSLGAINAIASAASSTIGIQELT